MCTTPLCIKLRCSSELTHVSRCHAALGACRFLVLSDDTASSSSYIASKDRVAVTWKGRAWKEGVVAYFTVLSLPLLGGTEKNYWKPQSWHAASGPRSEPGASRIRRGFLITWTRNSVRVSVEFMSDDKSSFGNFATSRNPCTPS
jgi:hypothetical protein